MKNKHLKILLKTIVFLSAIFIIVYTFFLIDIPEKFNKGYEIGLLLFNLSFTIISAFIFYLLIDYYPKKIRKKELLSSLEIHITRIEETYNTILKNLDYSGLDIDILTYDKCSNEVLKKVMANTNPDFRTDVNSLTKEKLSITELINRQKGYVENQIAELEKHIDFISTDLYKQLVNLKAIDLTLIFRAGTAMLKRINAPNQDLGIFSDQLFDYIIKVRSIREEWNKNEKN
ncbi:hypothetical protein RM549_15725 [Salegentibacter sp. F188]|uniref:Uncharacterized protein n=1 Tax=Autumnicola patrickiae TaxID=3075591 RepID=A0ABU3E5M8_9FLAO|nr:hypothetical protein [Salegentibacter sp. F188]MDT0691245.1 hypothetical protein [Salegentibacter sp. F188]